MSAALFDLAGRSAVVTGAGRGIGRGIAAALAAAGAAVMLAGRTASSLQDSAAAITEAGGSAIVQQADVAREDDVRALADAAAARFGTIDILVNNAGINPIWRTIEKTSLADWQAIIGVNLTGTFLCCKYIGALMAASGRGSIINISSVGGHVGLTRSAPYCATKGGIELLTKALALDWAPRGVRVNCLAPGYVDTDLTSGLLHHKTLGQPFLDHTPMGRFGQTGDIVGAAVFLAADASAYVTGHSLVVDGGWTAH